MLMHLPDEIKVWAWDFRRRRICTKMHQITDVNNWEIVREVHKDCCGDFSLRAVQIVD